MAITLVNCSMRCTRILSSVMRTQVHQTNNKFAFTPSCSPVIHQQFKNLHTGRILSSEVVKPPSSSNLPATDQSDILNTKIAQFRKKIGLYALTRNTLRLSAAHLYVACTDKVAVEIFLEELNLPDTFFSWFVITEIHVWMMMCRLMAEGPEGKFGRNELVKSLWEDCDKRITIYKLPRQQQKQMMMSLSDQFRAAVISYDEVSALQGTIYRKNGLLQVDKLDTWYVSLIYQCNGVSFVSRVTRQVTSNWRVHCGV